MLDLDGYEIFDPRVDRPLHEVTRKLAQQHFQLLMSEAENRIFSLKKVLKKNNIQLDGTDDSIQNLNDWFYENVEIDVSGNRPKPVWFSIVNDIALFLGSEIMKRKSQLKWTLFIQGKKDIAYQRPVIMGFEKVENKKYNIDFDYMLNGYAYRIIDNEASDERDYFLKIFNSALDYA